MQDMVLSNAAKPVVCEWRADKRSLRHLPDSASISQ
jgi:hypothetical protein